MGTKYIFHVFAVSILPLLSISCGKVEEEEGPEKVVVPEAVDLGLSVKWASFDVGATKPGQVGYYVAWGETAPKDTYYKWSEYAWCTGSDRSLTKYNYKADYGSVLDYRIALKQDDDIAHVLFGGEWRTPTPDEMKELIDCPFLTQSVENVDGVDCLRLTSAKTGNSILFPAAGLCDGTIVPRGRNYAGYYWSSTIDYSPYLFQAASINPSVANFMMVSPEVKTAGFSSMYMSTWPRAHGLNVRAVYGAEKQ